MRAKTGTLPLKDRYPRGKQRHRMEPGSPEWCYATIDYAKTLYASYKCRLGDWEKVLAEMEQHRVYERVPEEHPYGKMDTLLEAEIGATVEESRKDVALRDHGGDRRSEKAKADQVDNIKLKGGTQAAYVRALLARDHPEIKARLDAGEFRSVRAAAREAGLVRPTATIYTDDPAAAARAVRRHFHGDRLKALIAALIAALEGH
jgi:hypothetical protein